MTVLDLARLAGVDLNVAYRWVWLGKVPARKVVGKWSIERQDAEEFLRRRAAKRNHQDETEQISDGNGEE